MKLLVTGGAGFIGSHIVEQALAAGHEVAVIDNLSTGKRQNLPGAVRLYELDLRDRAATARAVHDFRPRIVSHQAAQASISVSVREPAFDAEVNVLGAIHLLDACCAESVEMVLFASTGGAIYGEVAEPERAAEQLVPKPYSPYAISKLTVEHLLRFYQAERQLESKVLRYANIYGPRQDAFGEAGVVAIFAERILRGQAIQVNARRKAGDDGCVRDYTYVGDVARVNLAAMHGEVRYGIMNVGTGVATTTLELARSIQRAAGRSVAVSTGAHRAGDLERSVLDPLLCSEVLGQLTPLEEGLRLTVEWYRTS